RERCGARSRPSRKSAPALWPAVQVVAVKSPATPRPSDRFGNAGPCGYAALEWSGSTWRIQVGLSNLPRITSAAATQHLSKRPLSGDGVTRRNTDQEPFRRGRGERSFLRALISLCGVTPSAGHQK